MPSEIELIEAIRDEPDRVETWLVYADQLLERGERAGELIATSHRGSARDFGLKLKKYLSQPDAQQLYAALKRGVVETTMHMGHWSVIATPPGRAVATDDDRDAAADAIVSMLQRPLGRFVRELRVWHARAVSAQLVGVAVEQHGQALRVVRIGAHEPWNGGGVLSAPRLREASLRNVREVGLIAHAGLEVLELETAPARSISEVVTSLRCPRLRALTLNGPWPEPWSGDVQLPALTSLAIEPTSAAIHTAAALTVASQLTDLKFTAPLISPATETLERLRPMFSPRLRLHKV